MNLCLKPKIFHFTREYNIRPIFINRTSFKKSSAAHFSADLIKPTEKEQKETSIMNFGIKVKNRRLASESSVCEISELEVGLSKKNITLNHINNFFARRKSSNKRARFTTLTEDFDESRNEIQGKKLRFKTDDCLLNKNGSIGLDYIEKTTKTRMKRKKIFQNYRKLTDKRQSVSIQADMSGNY
jgi:hypothetical protein